jgi:hypothetical protein
MAIVAVAAVGCGAADQAEVYPVKGVVTFNGKPMVGGGAISFYPVGPLTGMAPGGVIREDGAYQMTTYTEGDGSQPGEFRVVITQVTAKEPPPTKDGERATPGPISTVSEADRIPATYSDPYGSPLTAKVEAKDVNELNFELKPQP